MISECIQVQQLRLTRQRIFPQSINFNLNQVYLKKIELAQANQQQLYIASTVLADLRYYALLHQQSYYQLTFRTYYQQNHQKIAVLESVISLEGKIIQQIRSDYLSNIELLNQLNNAHYWLIRQTLEKLPIKSKKYKSLFHLRVALLITLLGYFIIVGWFSLSFYIQILSLIGFLILTLKYFKHWLLPYIQNIILHQLLFGVFSSDSKKRQIGFELLSFFT